MIPANCTAYLAPEELTENVEEEIGGQVHTFDRLVIAKGKAKQSHWAQNIWYEPQQIEIASIGDAAKKLKAIQRNWVLYDFDHHRRAKLIQEQLPHVSAKPLAFPAAAPTSPLGSWTLLEPNLILAAPSCSSAFPNGEIQFVENHDDPPSRAYLKLWECFTLLGVRPKPGDRCLDAGASPGGWSWVLAELGANVVAVDRTALEGKVAKSKLVTFERGDAFAVTPATHKTFDWLCCDLACYPDKLFEWVTIWLKANAAKNFVCTLKFQGKRQYGAIKKFEKIPGSALMHLHNNKHELTWVKLAQ